MGTAGLDVSKLAGLLERIKVECRLVEGDEAQDHCVLRLTSTKCPGQVALLEYVNQGTEPRLATILIEPPQDAPKPGINLSGSRKDDPEKIVDLVKRIFLSGG